jgi:2-haloacid dehalogenase
MTMPSSRRAFVQQLAGVTGALTTARYGARFGAQPARVDAVLFDAFPIFDPRPVAALAEREFPGRGAALMTAWRARQFEYQWLRALSGTYADFWQCTDDALRFAAASLRLDLAAAPHARLMNAHLELRPWSDVQPALQTLRSAGVRLGVLSNVAPSMLDTLVRAGGLADVFEHVVSTDRARTFKPDPRAYRLGVDALGLPRSRVAFAAFAGWDAAGAAAFGYPTFWVNRLQAPPEELGARPTAVGTTLDELVAFVRPRG